MNKIDLQVQEEKKREVEKVRAGIKRARGYTTSDTVHNMLQEYARANGFMRGDKPNSNAALDFLIRDAHRIINEKAGE